MSTKTMPFREVPQGSWFEADGAILFKIDPLEICGMLRNAVDERGFSSYIMSHAPCSLFLNVDHNRKLWTEIVLNAVTEFHRMKRDGLNVRVIRRLMEEARDWTPKTIGDVKK